MSDEDEYLTGLCKWYNEEKGYGFIKINDADRDVFVHANQLRKSGIVNGLTEGDRLRFAIEQGDKGKYAINISRVTDAQE
jgi:cold shock protein